MSVGLEFSFLSKNLCKYILIDLIECISRTNKYMNFSIVSTDTTVEYTYT